MPIRQKIAPRGCLTPHTILLAAALTFPSQIFAQTLKPKSVEGTDPLSVSASSSDNGPYGALWMAYLAPDGDLTVNVSHTNKLSGQTMSHHYRLTVTLGARQHSVSLSDPKAIGATDEVKRFLVVWNALFSDLPFRPELELAR